MSNNKLILLFIVFSIIFTSLPTYALDFDFNKLDKNTIGKDIITSPLGSIYTKIKDSKYAEIYGIAFIIIVLLLLLIMLSIPARLSIEIAGRLIGENPDVGFFGALFLVTMMTINPLLGLIFFMVWFRDEMPTYKVFILAFLTGIVLGVIELIILALLILMF